MPLSRLGLIEMLITMARGFCAICLSITPQAVGDEPEADKSAGPHSAGSALSNTGSVSRLWRLPSSASSPWPRNSRSDPSTDRGTERPALFVFTILMLMMASLLLMTSMSATRASNALNMCLVPVRVEVVAVDLLPS